MLILIMTKLLDIRVINLLGENIFNMVIIIKIYLYKVIYIAFYRFINITFFDDLLQFYINFLN
jgi:hypothetical protein